MRRGWNHFVDRVQSNLMSERVRMKKRVSISRSFSGRWFSTDANPFLKHLIAQSWIDLVIRISYLDFASDSLLLAAKLGEFSHPTRLTLRDVKLKVIRIGSSKPLNIPYSMAALISLPSDGEILSLWSGYGQCLLSIQKLCSICPYPLGSVSALPHFFHRGSGAPKV